MAQPAWLHVATVPQRCHAGSTSKPQKSSGDQWTSLGVTNLLARNLQLRGFKSPTPIQRVTIPVSLAKPSRDVLGMARTGSGKTLAYIIPMLHHLGSGHRETPGPRAIIMCPTRELALQILKVGKDLARGSKRGKEHELEPLRWSVIIGGTALDAQFESMSNSPDIVIATPGRFLHLLVEMTLDLKNTEMIIYDEADRLFEMGFESQLNEITARLPPTRQSLLFSATLPTNVAEFAQASLNNPNLIRLDAENSISPDLTLGFYLVKPTDKDAVLLIALRRLLRETPATPARKRQAIVFAATKHHVEYLTVLLSASGFATSSVFGSLDQVARQRQLKSFREGDSEVLVVTDVAARGLDIPIMDNVINYDHPPSSRLFIHRVGRTARAGQKGRAISLVTRDDLPYLCDLQTVVGIDIQHADPQKLGAVPRSLIDDSNHSLRGLEHEEARVLPALREVMRKGQGMYERSRPKASPRGYRLAKMIDIAATTDRPTGVHPDFDEDLVAQAAQANLLQSLSDFRPNETIIEIGRRGKSSHGDLMKQRRLVLEKKMAASTRSSVLPAAVETGTDTSSRNDPSDKFRDSAFYLQHEQRGRERDKGYSMASERPFVEGLQASTLDMVGDEGMRQGAQKASQLRWDRRKKRFTRGEQVGSDNKKMIRSESGALLPASYNSGRFRDWQAKRTRSGSIRTRTEGVSPETVKGTTSGVLPAQAIYRKRQEAEKVSSANRLKLKYQRKAKNARPSRAR